MNILNMRGRAGDTFSHRACFAVVESFESITPLKFKDAKKRLLTSLFLQIQEDDLLYCFGSSPSQTIQFGYIMTSGDTLIIKNVANIRAFNFISRFPVCCSTLVITPFYGRW